MAIKTIGQVLKEKRTQLGLGLSEAEELTQIQKLYIVALETDDYKALPGEFYIKAYLKQYAEKLDLNAERIIQAYDEGKGITVEDEEDLLESYHFVKPSERVDPEEEEGPKTWRNYIPIISLSAVALLILAGVVTAVLVNKPATPNLLTSDYSYAQSTTSKAVSKASSTSKQTPETSSSSSSSAQPTVAMTGSGSSVTATISQLTDPVTVTISAAAGSNIWVGVTNSNLSAGGQTLSDGANSLTTTLTTGATNAVITAGTARGLTITVNGQALNLSALTSTGTATITLQINR